jgi:hypothetical protein
VSNRRWVGAAAAFVVVVLSFLFLTGGGPGRGSSASRRADGWLGARLYLQARGARVSSITEPLLQFVERELPGRPGVLVVIFPLQVTSVADLDAAVTAHLDRGGDVVLGYSTGGEGGEGALALWRWSEPARVPLLPWHWRSFNHREWSLRPASPRSGRLPVTVWAPRGVPLPGVVARTLFAAPDGRPAISIFRQRRGRVVILPADALSNGRLLEGGNADLLEALFQTLGPRWQFDEYSHGLQTVSSGDARLGLTADLLLAHLALFYLLGVWALGRRQGPPWTTTAPMGGSAASFLLGLGALHERLGHHREAAVLLLRRVRDVDRGLLLPAELDRQAADADAGDLLAIARQVARLRRGGRPTTTLGDKA